jgi:transcriptional regulator with XRE-family HTH domain
MAQRAELGNRIREARTSQGWKQKHLAAEVRVEPITVSRWERGATTPDLDAIRLVAEATGRPLAYFLGEDVPVSPPSLEESVKRIEAAADRIAADADRIAAALEELRPLGLPEAP